MDNYRLIKALANTALTLHRAALLGTYKQQTWLKLLKENMDAPAAGDIVTNVAEWWKDPEERIGTLHSILRKHDDGRETAVIVTLKGQETIWRRAQIVKVYEQAYLYSDEQGRQTNLVGEESPYENAQGA